MTNGTYGPMSQTPSAYYDRDTSSWKTWQDTLPWEDSQSLVILPTSGMTRDGRLYVPRTSEPPTPAPAYSSLLPTPKTTDEDAGTPGDARRHSPGLRAVMYLLPTPVADHSRGLDQPGTDYQSLPNVALALLPTPTASGSSGGHRPDGTRYGPTSGTTLTDVTVRGVRTPLPSSGGKGSSDDPRQLPLFAGDHAGSASIPACPSG